jgi:uncharacterized protein YjdB
VARPPRLLARRARCALLGPGERPRRGRRLRRGWSGPAGGGGAIATIAIAPSALALEVGAAATVQATTLDAAGQPVRGQPIVWTSSDTTIVRITADGRAVGVAPGAAEIAANSLGRSARAVVTVGPRAVATVQITPDAPRLAVGARQQLAARAVHADGNLLADRHIVWASSDPRVATVDSTGLLEGRAAGVATITATAEGRTASVAATVEGAPVAALAVTPAVARLVVGQATQLVATARGASGELLADRPVAWRSADETVATVSSVGIVRGAAPGTTRVVATVDGRTAEVEIVVAARPVDAVIVSPAATTVQLGDTLQLTIQVTDAGGALLEGRAATFATSDADVARVSAAGLVTATGPGTATITVSSEGRSGTATVTVAPAAVATVAVSPSTLALTVGDTAVLEAVVRDGRGVVLRGQAIEWISGAPGVVAVSPQGQLTAVAPGSAVVLAVVGGRSGAVEVTVEGRVATAVLLRPSSARLVVGGTLALSADVVDARGRPIPDRPVTYATSDPRVAEVSSTGQVRALALGTAQITAVSGSAQGSASITVVAAAVVQPPVATVAVTLGAGSLTVGQTTQAAATPRDAQGNPVPGAVVAWSSSNPAAATVSATGVVTAVAAGSASIRATIEGRSGEAGVQVTAPPPPPPASVASVVVALGNGSLAVGATTQASAGARDADGNALTGRAVAWSTSNPAVATVSATGLVTAVAPGAASIRATVEGRTGEAGVQVAAPPPESVASVAVALGDATLREGQATTATATARDAQGAVLAGRATVWASSDPGVATVSATGVVTAVSPGTTTIQATVEGRTGTATLRVTPAPPRPVASVTVTLAAASLTIGQTTQAAATLRDASGAVLTGRAVVWTSSDPSVATVSGTGVVSAVAAGSATITATSEERSGSAAVRVQAGPPAPVAAVRVTPSAVTLQVGQGTTLAAAPLAADGTALAGRSVAWSSSNPAVATVDGGGAVRALAPGSATITATSEGRTGSATITVTAIPVASVVVALGSGSLTVGATTQASAGARDADGNALTGRAVAWSTSDPAVATVSATGLVTAVAPGSALIRATVEGQVGSASVQVAARPPEPVASVAVALGDATLREGQATTATATARDAQGAVLAGRATVWASSDPGSRRSRPPAWSRP